MLINPIDISVTENIKNLYLIKIYINIDKYSTPLKD